MSTWIFLRGLTRDSRHWGDFIDHFRRWIPGSQVVCIDLPGSGQFHQIESPIAIAELVGHCRKILRDRGIAPPFHILALSLGAMVAVEWANSAPQELRSCVLLNTSLRPFSPFYRRLRWRNYPVVMRMIVQGMHNRERVILDLVSNRNERRRELLPAWIAWQEMTPVSPRNALRQLYAAATYSAPQIAPTVPMLLLASKRDRVVHYSCTTRIARRWGVECQLHDEAGHDLPLDDGPWVVDRISAWLRTCSGS